MSARELFAIFLGQVKGECVCILSEALIYKAELFTCDRTERRDRLERGFAIESADCIS